MPSLHSYEVEDAGGTSFQHIQSGFDQSSLTQMNLYQVFFITVFPPKDLIYFRAEVRVSGYTMLFIKSDFHCECE